MNSITPNSASLPAFKLEEKRHPIHSLNLFILSFYSPSHPKPSPSITILARRHESLPRPHRVHCPRVCILCQYTVSNNNSPTQRTRIIIFVHSEHPQSSVVRNCLDSPILRLNLLSRASADYLVYRRRLTAVLSLPCPWFDISCFAPL
jgi:hypothetical protein